MGMYGMIVPATAEDVARLRAGDEAFEPFAGEGSASMEKMWHALHFLFTGTQYEIGSEPLSKAVLGGDAVGSAPGDVDVRYLVPDDVRAIASAFAATSFDAVWKRFDPDQMTRTEIYPQVWDEDPAELRAEIGGCYDAIAACYAEAAAAGKGMLLTIG